MAASPACRDCCCHRSAKLSLGYIEDGNIVCGYHGWAYAADGVCVKVPQQPAMPIPSCRVGLPHGGKIRSVGRARGAADRHAGVSGSVVAGFQSMNSTRPGTSVRCG
jgi:hypothetical protein